MLLRHINTSNTRTGKTLIPFNLECLAPKSNCCLCKIYLNYCGKSKFIQILLDLETKNSTLSKFANVNTCEKRFRLSVRLQFKVSDHVTCHLILVVGLIVSIITFVMESRSTRSPSSVVRLFFYTREQPLIEAKSNSTFFASFTSEGHSFFVRKLSSQKTLYAIHRII